MMNKGLEAWLKRPSIPRSIVGDVDVSFPVMFQALGLQSKSPTVLFFLVAMAFCTM
jgi:hypothetical protein